DTSCHPTAIETCHRHAPPEPTSTHPVLLHQNPPWTRAAKTKSSFEGGQPCERVQRSKAGGCSHPVSNTRCPEQSKTLPTNVIPAKADASGATDAVNPGSTTFRTYYHPR